MKSSNNPKPGTLAVWAGEDGPFWKRSTQVPVVHSVSFGTTIWMIDLKSARVRHLDTFIVVTPIL